MSSLPPTEPDSSPPAEQMRDGGGERQPDYERRYRVCKAIGRSLFAFAGVVLWSGIFGRATLWLLLDAATTFADPVRIGFVVFSVVTLVVGVGMQMWFGTGEVLGRGIYFLTTPRSEWETDEGREWLQAGMGTSRVWLARLATWAGLLLYLLILLVFGTLQFVEHPLSPKR